MPALHNKTIITNVWVPPRLDQIEVKLDRHATTPDSNGPVAGKEVGKLLLDGGVFDNGESPTSNKLKALDHVLYSVGSNKSTEETSSVSTGRSESSTPIQRSVNCALSNGTSGLNGVVASSPLAVITRCQLCEVDFPTSIDLQVHFHTEV